MSRALGRSRAWGRDLELDENPAEVDNEMIVFANEQLRTIAIGQSRAFSEGFLRLWRAERLGRTSATTA